MKDHTEANILLHKDSNAGIDARRSEFLNSKAGIWVYESENLLSLGIPPDVSAKEYEEILTAIREFGREDFAKLINAVREANEPEKAAIVKSGLIAKGWGFLADSIANVTFFVTLASNPAVLELLAELWKGKG